MISILSVLSLEINISKIIINGSIISIPQAASQWFHVFALMSRSHSGRSGRRHVWRALWFFLLLFYAPLLHTCAAILKCPILHSTTGKRVSKYWRDSNNVDCIHGQLNNY